MKTMSKVTAIRCGFSSVLLVLISACANTNTSLGEGGSMVSGSAGAAGNQDAATELVQCSRPIGTAALVEPDTQYMAIFTQYGLQSPVPLVKLLMAQSGCFQVVNRGAASKALERERALASGGELQKGSNMGGGQMVAADYLVTPTIVNRDSDAGGSFGGLGGLLPGSIGAIAGALGVNTVVSILVVFAVGVAGFLITFPELPLLPLVATITSVAALFPIFFYPFSKTLWTAIDLRIRPPAPGEVRDGYADWMG